MTLGFPIQPLDTGPPKINVLNRDRTGYRFVSQAVMAEFVIDATAVRYSLTSRSFSSISCWPLIRPHSQLLKYESHIIIHRRLPFSFVEKTRIQKRFLFQALFTSREHELSAVFCNRIFIARPDQLTHPLATAPFCCLLSSNLTQLRRTSAEQALSNAAHLLAGAERFSSLLRRPFGKLKNNVKEQI